MDSNQNDNNGHDDSFNKSMKESGPYLNLGIQLALPIVLFFFVGKWIDDSYGTKPWWMVGFTFFGFVVGFYNFIKVVIKLNKKK